MTSPDRVDLREKVVESIYDEANDFFGAAGWGSELIGTRTGRMFIEFFVETVLHNVSGKEDEGRQTINDPQCVDEGTLPSLTPSAGVSGEVARLNTPDPYFCQHPACVGLPRCPRDPVCND